MDHETRVSKLLREARSHANAAPQLHRPETPADVGRQLQSRTGSRGALRRLSGGAGGSGGYGDLGSPASLQQISSGGGSFSSGQQPPPRKLEPLHPSPPNRDHSVTPPSPAGDGGVSPPSHEGSGGVLAQYEQTVCEFVASSNATPAATEGGTMKSMKTYDEVKLALRGLESSASKLRVQPGATTGASSNLLQALHVLVVSTGGRSGAGLRASTPPTEGGEAPSLNRHGSTVGSSSSAAAASEKPSPLQVHAAVLLAKILPMPPPSAVRVLTYAMKYGQQPQQPDQQMAASGGAKTGGVGNGSREDSNTAESPPMTGLLRSKRLLDPFIQLLRGSDSSGEGQGEKQQHQHQSIPPERGSRAAGSLVSLMNLLMCIKVAVTKDEDSRKASISSGIIPMLVQVMEKESSTVQELVANRSGGEQIKTGNKNGKDTTTAAPATSLLPIYFEIGQSVLDILKAIHKSDGGYHLLLKLGILSPMVKFLTPALSISPITPGKEEKHPLNSYARLLSKLVGKDEENAVQDLTGSARPATPPPPGAGGAAAGIEMVPSGASLAECVVPVLQQLVGILVTFHNFPLVVSQLGYVLAVLLGGGGGALQAAVEHCTSDILALVLVSSELAKTLQADLQTFNTTGALSVSTAGGAAQTHAEKLGWLRIRVDSLACISRLFSNISLDPQGGSLLVQRTAMVDKFVLPVLEVALAGVSTTEEQQSEDEASTPTKTSGDPQSKAAEEDSLIKLDESLAKLGLESLLSLANNSYYFTQAFVTGEHVTEDDKSIYGLTLDLLTPFLMTALLHEFSHDYVSAAARTLANISACTIGRQWLATSRLDQAILLLLRHRDWRVVFSCVGCFVNLTGDHAVGSQNAYSALSTPDSQEGQITRECLVEGFSGLGQRLSEFLEEQEQEQQQQQGNGKGGDEREGDGGGVTSIVESIAELQRVIRGNLNAEATT